MVQVSASAIAFNPVQYAVVSTSSHSSSSVTLCNASLRLLPL
jgi:hypothetical protein